MADETNAGFTVYEVLWSVVNDLLHYSRRFAFSTYVPGILPRDCDELYSTAVTHHNMYCDLKVDLLLSPVLTVEERYEGCFLIIFIFGYIIHSLQMAKASTCGLFHFVNILVTQITSSGEPYEISLVSHLVTKVLLTQLTGSIEYGQLPAAHAGQEIIEYCADVKYMLVQSYDDWDSSMCT